MVIYYSATGNTEFIAKEIAQRLGDECVNILERVKKQDYSPLHSEKPFVICAPVIVCEMPRFMTKYLKKQTFTGNREAYFVFTSGGYCGISGVMAKSIIKKKGMKYRGHAEFKMPRNYVANDHYPMLDRPEIEKRITDCYNQAINVAQDILSGKNLKARHIYFAESVITLAFNPVWCRYKLTAKEFYVKENCIGCGKCEKLCPLNNIYISEGRPVWGDRCTHCMACIGNCPADAIEYGTITKDKEQYNFGKYRYVVDNIKK